LCPQNDGVPCHKTSQLFKFLFPSQHIKRPPLQNKRVGVLRMAFRIRKVFDSFEKHTPDHVISKPESIKKIQIQFPFHWEEIGKDRILMSQEKSETFAYFVHML